MLHIPILASHLNPDDIESVSVLKGGAATALYGLQAANGVIMITTKKGSSAKENSFNVSFNTIVEIDQVSQLPKMQNEFAQGSKGIWIGPDNGGTNKSWCLNQIPCAMMVQIMPGIKMAN